jgi:Ulp1 family protease
MKSFNEKATRRLIAALKPQLKCPTAKVVKIENTQQTNSYDCGVILLANAENAAKEFEKNGTVASVAKLNTDAAEKLRKEMFEMIEAFGIEV